MRISSIGVAVFLGLAGTALAQSPANRFGFTGPEIFPVDSGISLLCAADLDGDGLNDLVVVNNDRSKINLLYNQTGKSNAPAGTASAVKREMNELPPDARFRVDSIASEKRISALLVTDLNADGRPDIAYYGEPRELVVQYNQGTNGWSAIKRWPISDGQLTPNALAAGDLNGDGRADLVLLADSGVHVLSQREDHTLAEPQKIPVSGTVRAVQVLDVDGDGRADLMLVNWDNPSPFRFRLQSTKGQLSPEMYFTLPPIRSYTLNNLVTNERVFVVTIAQNSGRSQVSEFQRKPADPLSGKFRQGQFQVLPLGKSDKARRGMIWADVNDDSRADLLVAEPENGQLSVYLQSADGSLASPKTYSALAGVSDLAVADWDGDGRPEIFLLSADERAVAVTRFDNDQRLPFPTLIPVDGRPLAFAVGPLQAVLEPTLAVLVDQDGKRALVTRTADGKSKTQKLNETFTSNPSTLALEDVNQDGLMDLVALIPYEKIKILLQIPGRDFQEVDVAPPGGVIDQPWLAHADVDGDGKPELLLPQKNFLRAVVLKPTTTNRLAWTFEVKDQINGAGSNSRLVAATALPNGTNAIPSLFLLDVERKALTLCERDAAGIWQIVRNIELPVSDFNSLDTIALGASAPNTVALGGLNTIAWLSLTGDVWELHELDGYETPIKGGYLNDVVAGDLDNDGRKDLVFMETAKHYLDLVIFDSAHKLVPADRWPVFEERTFRRGGGGAEPREAAVADVTGDGRNDLIVLVHDRILVYPQE